MHLIYLRLAPLSLDILGAPGQEQRGSECVCVYVSVCVCVYVSVSVCVFVCEKERGSRHRYKGVFFFLDDICSILFILSLFYCDEMKSIFCGRSMQIILIAAN